MKIFFIHGFDGDENDNWFPWLREKLQNDEVEVIIPNFPTPENQKTKGIPMKIMSMRMTSMQVRCRFWSVLSFIRINPPFH